MRPISILLPNNNYGMKVNARDFLHAIYLVASRVRNLNDRNNKAKSTKPCKICHKFNKIALFNKL